MNTTTLTIFLGGHLKEEAKNRGREIQAPLPDPPIMERVLEDLGLRPDRVKLILINGKGGTLSSPLRGGERIALFPPELSFNTFVSLSFREEMVRGRIKES